MSAVSTRTPAEPVKRFIAAVIDYLPFIGVYIVALILGKISGILGSLVLLVGMIGWWVYNSILQQGKTGQTLGKKQQGITLLSTQTGQPLGAGPTFVRLLLASIFDVACYINSLSILFNKEHQRFSDGVVKANVYNA